MARKNRTPEERAAARRAAMATAEPPPEAPPPLEEPHGNTFEQRDGQTAGALIADMALDKFAKTRELAETLGVPKAMIEGLIRRARTRYLPLKEELHRIQSRDIQELLDDRVFRLLQYMDDSLMANASLRDVAYALDRMLNYRQLMRGEPTAILSVEDRRTLNELIPALVREAQRRGVLIEGQAVHVPDAPAPAGVPSGVEA